MAANLCSPFIYHQWQKMVHFWKSHKSALFKERVFYCTFIVKKFLFYWKTYVCTLKQQQSNKILCLFKHSNLIKLLFQSTAVQ